MRLTLCSASILSMLTAAIPVAAQSKPLRLKVQCIGHSKSLILWVSPSPSSAAIAGEVKCGQKVTVTGEPVSAGGSSYVPVRTSDNRTGYLPTEVFAFTKSAGHSGKDVVQAIADAMNAYARTADPHIAWCDNHGGFQERTTDTETVNITDTNTGTPLGTGTISHTYIVCKDGTRIKE